MLLFSVVVNRRCLRISFTSSFDTVRSKGVVFYFVALVVWYSIMLQYFYENMLASSMKIVNEGRKQGTSVSLTFDKFIGMQQQYTD